MSILYYSNFCQHSKEILSIFGKKQLAKDIHFICIDNRVSKQGKKYIILPTGQEILLPEMINKVPAMLHLNTNQILYGNDILSSFKPQQQQQTQQSTKNNMEPNAFQDGFGGFGSGFGGVSSDAYSFLDQGDSELSVKGEGGMRQMHHYVSLNETTQMNLPEENYNSNKIKDGDIKLEELIKQRDQDIAFCTPK